MTRSLVGVTGINSLFAQAAVTAALILNFIAADGDESRDAILSS
jgi:hypothetical protein